MSTPRPKQTARKPKAYTEKMLKGTVPWRKKAKPLRLRVAYFPKRLSERIWLYRLSYGSWSVRAHGSRDNAMADTWFFPTKPRITEVRIVPVPSKGRKP